MTRLLDQIRLFERVFNALQAMFPKTALDVRYMPDDEAIITVPSNTLKQAVHLLLETFDFYHLSTITGLDTGEELEILYHFWNRYGLTLCIKLPKQEPHVPTLTELIPGAALYEREIHEMLGVIFKGLDVSQPLLLPDDWNDGPPLLKEEQRQKDES